MKKQQGKFILFDIAEFAAWLNTLHVNRTIRLVQNHHTFIPAYKNFKKDNHFALLDSMERSHLERGFNEIAQNLTTFPDGTVAVCRSLDKIPAGIKGANLGGICIENLGNFDAGNDNMTPEHRDAIIKLNALLAKKFSLKPTTDSIVYHHWYDLTTGQRTNGTGNTKTCPGTAFFGGNTVEAAEKNFIPLVIQEIAGARGVKAVPKAKPLFTARVTADDLNVRSRPNAAGKIVKELTRGIEVQVYAEKGNWSRIHPVEPHWVNSRFLEKSEAEAA